jgi:hypothetical protein
MAQKKGNGIIFIAIMVFCVLIIFLSIATPIILLVGYFYSKSKFNEIGKNLSNSVSDFWLTDKEKEQYKDTYDEYNKALNIIEKAHKKAEKANISKNKDGSYSLRSNLGKEISHTLEESEPFRDSLESDLDDFQQTPLNKWKSFNEHASRERIFLYSFYFWCVVNIYYFIKYGFNSTKIIQAYRDISISSPLTIAAVLTIFVFIIFYFVIDDRGTQFSPIPPEVTMDNVDDY